MGSVGLRFANPTYDGKACTSDLWCKGRIAVRISARGSFRRWRRSGELLDHEEAHYEEIYKWFSSNLYRPRRFSRSSKPHAKRVAVSWFKGSALEHIQKMREIAAILEDHGIHTEMISSSRPGYIVYEDAYQIAAELFADQRA